VWIDPSLAGSIGIAGNPYPLLAAIGLLALAAAFATGMMALAIPTDGVAAPDVERFATTDTPGDEFEDALAELAGRRGRAARPVEDRERIRERLHADAVRTIRRVADCDTATAREQVATGEWTEDRYAAAFLGDDVPGPAWWQRLRDRLRRVDPFERRALRTAAAIATYDDATAPPDGGGEPP